MNRFEMGIPIPQSHLRPSFSEGESFGIKKEATFKRKISQEVIEQGEVVIADLKAKKKIDWRNITGEPLLYVMQEYAGDKPVSFVRRADLIRQNLSQESTSLRSLLNYAEKERDRSTGETVVEFLHRRAGIKYTTEDVKVAMQDPKIRVPWKIIPEVTKEILEEASLERNKGVGSFQTADFKNPYDFLNGTSLKDILDYYSTDVERNGKAVIPYIFEKLGLSQFTTQDVLTMFRQQRFIKWDQVSHSTIREILEMAAVEKQKPVHTLTQKDFKAKYDFLGGITLIRIYNYAQTQEDRGEMTPVTYLMEKLGISKFTSEDVITLMREKRDVNWDRVSSEAIRDMLEIAAYERKKLPYTLTHRDFKAKYKFLHGADLIRIYDYAKSQKDRGEKRPFEYLMEKVKMVDLLVEDIKAGKIIRWDRVSKSVIKNLLEKASEELPNNPPLALISGTDLHQEFTFLNDRSLQGLKHLGAKLKRRSKDKTEVTGMYNLRKYLGIPQISVDDIAFAYVNNKSIIYRDIPYETKRELLERAAAEVGKTPEYLTDADINRYQYNFLGGKTLAKFFSYYFHQLSKEPDTEMSVKEYMKTSLGFESKDTLPRDIRKEKMQQIFQAALETEKGFDQEKVMELASTVSHLYYPYLRAYGMDKSELLDESYAICLSFIRDNSIFEKSAFEKYVYTQMETFMTAHKASWFYDISLQSPLARDKGQSNPRTIEGVLAEMSAPAPEKVIFSREMNALLARLTPIEKALIVGITVDGYTFGDLLPLINGDFSTHYNSDQLQEMYEKTMAKLRQQIQTEDKLTGKTLDTQKADIISEKPARKLTIDERRDIVIDLYNKGVRQADIAKITGVSLALINMDIKYLLKNAILTKRRRFKRAKKMISED